MPGRRGTRPHRARSGSRSPGTARRSSTSTATPVAASATYIEVPTARYVAEAGSGLACGRLLGGGQEPFPPEKLASLYKSHDDYVRKVTRLVQRFEREGWLLLADARAVREQAVRSDIP